MASAKVKLIKALKKDENGKEFWWDILGSISEARKIILAARKEFPSQNELDYLISLLEIKGIQHNAIDIYKACLKELQKELIQLEN